MEKNISFIDKNLMADFLDKVKVKLKDKSVRITLIETEKLFLNRMLYIKDLIEQDDIDKYYDELCESLNGLGPKVFLKASKEVCIAAAYTDFARGQIPYFELNLNNSTLYQKNRERNTIIAKFSDKDDSSYLDTIIADRMQKLVGIEDSTPEEGSQSPSEIEE